MTTPNFPNWVNLPSTTHRYWRLLLVISITIACLSIIFMLFVLPGQAQSVFPENNSQLQQSALAPVATILPPAYVTIPQIVNTPPTFDGVCTKGEYPTSATFSDANSFVGTVYFVQDATSLYVCISGAAGSNQARFYAVYLSTENTTTGFAGPTDYGLDVDILTGVQKSVVGTGVANYTPADIPGWSAKTTFGNGDTAEYVIPLALTGGACGSHFRIGVYHHWVVSQGGDYGWPSNKWYDSPGSWKEAVLSLNNCGSGKIAYIYREDTVTAAKIKDLLQLNGYSVDLIPLSTFTTTTNLASYAAVIVADDTGRLNEWGLSAGQPGLISGALKPTLGLGEGGYAYFGKHNAFIGWPHGWHGPNDKVMPENSSLAYYHDPYDFSGLVSSPMSLYSSPVNEVGIYTLLNMPANVTLLGYEPPAPGGKPDHASLVTQDCTGLWGFSNGPQDMTANGKKLFVNTVNYLIQYTKCTQTPPPPQNGCLKLDKIANPLTSTGLSLNQGVKYSLNYQVANTPECANEQATLVDAIPYGTQFIPGSEPDGVVPNTEGMMVWSGLGAGAAGTKTFAVTVVDNACANGKITNIAKLSGMTGAVLSTALTHSVSCPPVIPANREPPYAEDEVAVYPYPFVAGHVTQLSARLTNNSDLPHTVTVTFQTAVAPNRFGIGLRFAAIDAAGNPRVVTIPPRGIVQVKLDWTPAFSGQVDIQVMVQSPGYSPIFTQRNLDVSEDFKPGIQDNLSFKVANPTGTTGDITVVVVNTCPGWSASVLTPIFTGVGPNNTDIRTEVLQVTPPSGTLFGTGCHIDVQAWLNDVLLGGIRKLDVPPVNLPIANPPWEEKEISTIPDPAIVGGTNQLCIELQNPLTYTKNVTVTYSQADFGAGVGFIPVGSHVNLALPPLSINKYCINWTPEAGGTLHRCLMVTLSLPNYEDQHSQHNFDIVRSAPIGSSVDFAVGNTFPFTRTLLLRTTTVGMTGFTPFFPDAPPTALNPGQVVFLKLQVHQATLAPSQVFAAVGKLFGDSVRVEVSVFLGGDLISGFTVEFKPYRIMLPYMPKK